MMLSLLFKLMAVTLIFLAGYVLTHALVIKIKRKVMLKKRLTQKRDQFLKEVNRHFRQHERRLAHSSWTGFREFIVSEKVFETESIVTLYCRAKDDAPLAPFVPGQYVVARITIDGRLAIRCYCLSDSPMQDGYYRLCIQKARDTSTFIYDHLQVGDAIKFKMPQGEFLLPVEQTPPLVLIAEGIGLSPMLALVNTLDVVGFKHDVWLFVITNPGERVMMLNHLEQLQQKHDHFHFMNIENIEYTNMMFSDMTSVLPASNFQYYLCAQGQLLLDFIHCLLEWGVPRSDIHFDTFDSDAIRANTILSQVMTYEERQVEVLFSRSNISATWTPKNGSILEFGESLGLELKFGCRMGRCGSCALKLSEGEVQYLMTPEVEVREGNCLTCIAMPSTRVVLDA